VYYFQLEGSQRISEKNTETPLTKNKSITKEAKMAELVRVANKLSEETLNSLASVEDAIAALGLSSVDELTWDSSPYSVIEDKSKLIGKKFLAVQWVFRNSDEYLSEYVSVYIITSDTIDGQTHFVLNDGSTGICAQLRGLTNKRENDNHPTPFGGALIKGGLHLSEYDRTDEKGTVIGRAKTYYLAN
jgi:hypothetical protein